MARKSGRDVFIGCSPGTNVACPFTLGGRSNTATLNLTSEEVDVTSFGALYRERVPDALRDWVWKSPAFGMGQPLRLTISCIPSGQLVPL